MEEKIHAKILIIDDDESFCIVTSNLLRLDGHEVSYLVDVHEGFLYVQNNPDIDIVLLDIDLSADISGVEAIPRLLEAGNMIQIIMLTSQQALDTGIQCMKSGAYDYLVKPFKKEQLNRILPGALESKRLKQLNTLYLEIMVHDLKGPLQSIAMGIDVLCAEQPVDAKIREQSKNLVKFGTWQIQNMISNILNVSKFEKFAFPLNIESFPVEKEIRESVAYLTDRILYTKKEFELTNREQKDFLLTTDRGLFMEITTNLLNNAIRYTNAGDRIQLELSREKHDLVCIKVSNSGSFIEESYRDKIFDKFFKSRYAQDKQTRNFGLGLTFSKLAVEALGGTIRVECTEQPPETNFYFTIKNQKHQA